MSLWGVNGQHLNSLPHRSPTDRPASGRRPGSRRLVEPRHQPAHPGRAAGPVGAKRVSLPGRSDRRQIRLGHRDMPSRAKVTRGGELGFEVRVVMSGEPDRDIRISRLRPLIVRPGTPPVNAYPRRSVRFDARDPAEGRTPLCHLIGHLPKMGRPVSSPRTRVRPLAKIRLAHGLLPPPLKAYLTPI